MSRSALFIFLLSVALCTGAVRLASLSKQNADLVSQNQDLQAQVGNLKALLLKEHMKEQTEIFAAQTAVEQLQDKMKIQSDLVAAAEQRLHQEQNGGVGGKQLPAIRKITSQKQLIADLEQRLQELRQSEGELKNQDRFYQQQAGLTQKQADDQVKTQISEQERLLKQMNDQLKNFRRDTPIDGQYAEKYGELKARIQVQKNTVQQLKDQRTSTNAQWGVQKTSSHSQNQQDLGGVKSSEQEVQAQLLREKTALQSLTQDLQSGVQTQKSQEALIQTAEADYRNQKAKLQDLQSQLGEAQNRLKVLSPQTGTVQ